MAHITLKKKPTSDQLKEARKGGFKTTRPSKPTRTAAGTPVTLARLEAWKTTYNNWVDKVNAGVAKCKAIEADNKKLADLKKQVSER